MAHRVLVTDKLADEGLALLRAEPGIEVVLLPTDKDKKLDVPSLRGTLAEVDGIIISSEYQLTGEVLAVNGGTSAGRAFLPLSSPRT